MQSEPDLMDTPPAELGRAGAVIDKAISYMMDQNIDPVAIASALLGGSLGLLAQAMDDAAVLRILDSACESVRAGELRRLMQAPPEE
ncbi:MAG: hypothetical protein JOY71_01625 [Acetobacteraceae bacterium]|nr:hypothetical protein [Acetobacteraceae bacterium]MBV8520826.1 hypothetical protein [Acetobacteraceae bacterium]